MHTSCAQPKPLDKPCPWPRYFLLDVGHGNSSILQSKKNLIFDSGQDGKLLLLALKQLGITEIDAAVFSHPDADHIGGLPYLLDNIFVKEIYANSDPRKKGAMWKDPLCLRYQK